MSCVGVAINRPLHTHIHTGRQTALKTIPAFAIVNRTRPEIAKVELLNIHKLKNTNIGLLDPRGSRMIPLPGIQFYLRPRVTLSSDLLTPKVDRFLPLLCGLCQSVSKSVHSTLVFNILCSCIQFCNRRTNGRTDRDHCASA